MCLHINNYRHGNRKIPLIAEYNILVWKYLHYCYRTKTYYSPCQGKKYELNKLNTVGRMLPEKYYGNRDDNTIGRGLHAYIGKHTPFPYYSYSRSISQFPAIIPKGSKFFIGQGRDIVSDNIIVYENMNTLLKAHGVSKVTKGNINLHKLAYK